MAKLIPFSKKIFFNYATVAPLHPSAYKEARSFLDEYLKIGPPEVLEKYDNWYKKLINESAKLLHCNASELINIKNTTEGLIIAAESIPFKKGDEVLLMANDYPSHLIAWLKKKKDGVNVILVEGADNDEIFSNLLKRIGPKTKAISISWIQHYDGYMVDINLLSKICQKKNIFLVVDAAHAVGAIKVDLRKTHIDILSCGGQKALAALPGTGLLYINQKTLRKLKDFKVGLRSVASYDKNGYTLKDSTERYHDGTQNLIGIVSLYAAIKAINKIGILKIEKKNNNILKTYKKILQENQIPFINYKHQGFIISLKISNSQELIEFLRKRNIYLKSFKNVARLSFSHDSTVKDFTIAVKQIKAWSAKNYN